MKAALRYACENDVSARDLQFGDRQWVRGNSLVSFLSNPFTPFPGSLTLTGTPAGAEVFREPSVYMKDGDEGAVEIKGIEPLVSHCQAGED